MPTSLWIWNGNTFTVKGMTNGSKTGQTGRIAEQIPHNSNIRCCSWHIADALLGHDELWVCVWVLTRCLAIIYTQVLVEHAKQLIWLQHARSRRTGKTLHFNRNVKVDATRRENTNCNGINACRTIVWNIVAICQRQPGNREKYPGLHGAEKELTSNHWSYLCETAQ